MSVELGLAGLATADLAIKYGKILVDLYSSFKNANAEIYERCVIVEVNWTKTEHQIDFLRKIWKTLSIELRDQQSQLLDILASKLDAAVKQIERVQRKKQQDTGTQINRVKYALVKESIDKAVRDLEIWQKMFDPSWYLILKVADPVIDLELDKNVEDTTKVGSISTARGVRSTLRADPRTQTSIFRPKSELDPQREHIPYCTAKLGQRVSKSDKASKAAKYYIIDSVPCLPEVNDRILMADVRELARKLSAADPSTFGLLQCRGVIKEMDRDHRRPVSFDFVFSMPPGLQSPKSLRHILLSPDPSISLTDRFRIAQQLAQSVSYVHTYGFVHKSIRPDTVLIFEDSKSQLAASFLLGFERFRTVSGRTLRAGDCVWEKDLYRHPRRQGLKPEDEYTMQHDIYSLGVCLLEIGLWESFVISGNESRPSVLLPAFISEEEDEVKKASLVKDSLVELAKRSLPSRMGNKYTEVVVNCLTCLDESNIDFGDQSEFEDEDGILIGVRYIEKILHHLNSIAI